MSRRLGSYLTVKDSKMTQSQLSSSVPPSNAAPAYSGTTTRKDNWWAEPALVAFAFTLFGLYATGRALENNYFEIGPYLSPFYSPLVQVPGMPSWFSPALWILPFPLAFRATCYYYRKAYYRAYFATPPACTVGIFKGKGYTGEYAFPFVLQNLHRYAFYFAVPVLGVLWWDALKTLYYDGGFHMSVLTMVMLYNVILLSGYTFGCHAFRHLAGGNMDCFSCKDGSLKPGFKMWHMVTKLNERHMQWAWCSLLSVAAVDLYIRFTCINPSLDFKIF
jgi:hypothetical protein